MNKIDLGYIHVCNVYRCMLKRSGTVNSCKRWSDDRDMFDSHYIYLVVARGTKMIKLLPETNKMPEIYRYVLKDNKPISCEMEETGRYIITVYDARVWFGSGHSSEGLVKSIQVGPAQFIATPEKISWR